MCASALTACAGGASSEDEGTAGSGGGADGSGRGGAIAAGGGSAGTGTAGASGPSGVAGAAGGTSGAAGATGIAGSDAGARGGGSAGAFAGRGGTSGLAGSSGAGGRGGGSGGRAGSGGLGAAGGGGAGAGGATACDWSEPPANVAAWVEESWKAQLGDNIRNRKAWNLDNVMLNKGSLNLCVRWGATSAVPDTVRMNLAATIERWFNDWFKGLGDYGCFPYGAGIKVKVTGWAVKPGMQALLGAIDPAIPVYTETDADGEPKCPDACSSFVHWDHKFTGCPGGEAAHSDYWLWFDDALPGGGGAAAVGGDWGLRMPVKTFTNAFNNTSYMILRARDGARLRHPGLLRLDRLPPQRRLDHDSSARRTVRPRPPATSGFCGAPGKR